MKTIRGKLIVLVCLTSFIICLVLTVLNSYMMNRTAIQDMDESVTSTTTAYSKAIENVIEIYKTKVQSMATDSRITPLSSVKSLKALADDMCKQYGFSLVSFATADGKPYDMPEVDITQRAYFISAMAGTPYISSPLVNKKDSTIVLYVSAKVNNNTGYNGIVFAELSNDVFSQIIKDVSIGEKGYGFLIDITGTIIAHKDNSKVESFTNYITLAESDASYADLGNFISTAMNNKSGTANVTVEGSEKYIAYTPVNNTDGWILGVAADKEEMLASYRQGLTISIAVTFFFLLISFLFSILSANSIGKPISLVTKRLELLSKGDLSSPVPSFKTKDETKILAASLEHTVDSLSSYIKDIHFVLSNISSGNLNVNTDQEYVGDFVNIKTDMEEIIESLNKTMASISAASEQVSSGSVMISNSSMALSQGATEQASAIEELTASVEAIAAKTSLNAQNAENANQMATSAKKEAEIGDDQMSELLKAMDTINASSGNISKIIKVIDDIAFQTNILALNAAVEAARAGQHGKGFAVVAEEVRSLAAKSAKAAKETADMIEGSIGNVETGIHIANRTAEALKKIVTEVTNATDLVGSIAVASKEQAMSIEQINRGIVQVSSVIQTNAATSEESAAASEELSSQAMQLKEVVSIFKMKDSMVFESENASVSPTNAFSDKYLLSADLDR